MIDALRSYHTMLRSTGSSGYPNMSLYNPQHQQMPFPLAGQVEPLYNPYQRIPERTYSQVPQQSIGMGRRYMSGIAIGVNRRTYNNTADIDFLRR